MKEEMQMPPEKAKELDREAEQDFEEFDEYEREHRGEDERTYGEVANDDINRSTVEEDADEFQEE